MRELRGHPLDPRKGDRYRFAEGEIRVDEVRNGPIYFVQWRGDEEIGTSTRMRLNQWREAVGKLRGWVKPAAAEGGER